MFKSSEICSFGSTIKNLGSYHFGAYIGWWNFLMGVLTMNGTDLFGHFNLELDEINPRTFLDTFRNLFKHFLSRGGQRERERPCIKCSCRDYKAQKLPPKCDILTGMWLLADKNWHVSELFRDLIQEELSRQPLIRQTSKELTLIGQYICIKVETMLSILWKVKWDGFRHEVRVTSDTCPMSCQGQVEALDAGNMSFDEILWVLSPRKSSRRSWRQLFGFFLNNVN